MANRAFWFGAWLLLCPLYGCGSSKSQVVLYCAQDKEFADRILVEFTQRTGLEVAPKFDTEAQKSIPLYAELVHERSRPRCDVFWNNEILWTIRLQRQELLEPYRSPAAEPYPAWAKAKDGNWTAFAARARVIIVNTRLVAKKKWPRSIFDLTKPEWKSKAAIAKPLYGTSMTQAACLFDVLGPEEAKRFYRDLLKNDIQIASGNKQVAVGVSQGQYQAGITDTDDAMMEVEAGRPVELIYPDRDRPDTDRMGTLFIPNTVAVIRGCPHPESARRLVDYLLSPEVESQLAESASRQAPLNPQATARLPKPLETTATVKAMRVDFEKAADWQEEARKFLTAEFTAP
jgi:iron(III) transport system substrate-binding protein